MSLLAKKFDQSVIMDDIKITILKTKRGYLQVGIEVTDDVKLHREVIYKRILIESESKSLNLTDIAC